MTEWNEIRPELNNKLQWEWYNKGFTAEQTKEWIDAGLKPADYQFAAYLRDIIACSPEEIASFGDLETLKEQHQEYLQSQNTTSEEDETQSLAEAIKLSLGIFSPDDIDKQKLSDQELEKYLQEKRLELKKYFIFNLGQEVIAESVVAVADKSEEIVSEPVPNIRLVKPSLTEHLTKLFNDGNEKIAISFTGKNTNQPSLGWTGDQLTHKIKNGEECYIAFDKSKIDTNSNYVRKEASATTQLGEMSWPKIIVLAVEAAPQVKVFQSKKKTLKFLRKNEFECQAVSCEREKVANQDYCLYHQTCLAKLEEKKDIPGIVHEIDTFETWFNGNCGYVISKDSETSAAYPFFIWIVVYEPEKKKMNENLAAIEYNTHYEKLLAAQRKAKEIKEKLQEDNWQANPILLIHCNADIYTSFSNIVNEPWVIKTNIPYEEEEGIVLLPIPPTMMRIPAKVKSRVPNKNPDEYLNPLDVVWVKMNAAGLNFYHVGIYLGQMGSEHKICQFSKEKQSEGAMITGWKDFVRGCIDGEIFAYHPVLPFKHYWKIVRQIAQTEESEYRKNNYNLGNRNCEHFANMCVYGINYSSQIENRKSDIISACRAGKFTVGGLSGLTFIPDPKLNNDKGSTIKLTEEIKESNKKLGYSRADHWRARQLEARIQIPPKKDCWIM